MSALSFDERSRLALVARGDAVLALLPPGASMVEVGVHRGHLAEYVLSRRSDVAWWGIDSWLATELQPEAYRATGDIMARTDAATMAEWKADAHVVAARYGDRARIIEEDSVVAALAFGRGSVDLCFIDAAHHHKAVLADCAAWWPVVKSGGWLAGHDYVRNEQADVNRAVREFAQKVGQPHAVGGGTVWRIRKRS